MWIQSDSGGVFEPWHSTAVEPLAARQRWILEAGRAAVVVPSRAVDNSTVTARTPRRLAGAEKTRQPFTLRRPSSAAVDAIVSGQGESVLTRGRDGDHDVNHHLPNSASSHTQARGSEAHNARCTRMRRRRQRTASGGVADGGVAHRRRRAGSLGGAAANISLGCRREGRNCDLLAG